MTDETTTTADTVAQLDASNFWGIACPDCGLTVPFNDPDDTDLEATFENWGCPECPHAGVPHLAVAEPTSTVEIERESVMGEWYAQACPECERDVLAYGVPSDLDGATVACEGCPAGVTLDEDELGEPAVDLDHLDETRIHIWDTSGRDGVEGGFNALYGEKDATKRRLTDTHLKNQHGHGPAGALQPGRDYDGVEYVGTLAGIQARYPDPEEPVLDGGGLPKFPHVLSRDGLCELKDILCPYITNVVKLHCRDCGLDYPVNGVLFEDEDNPLRNDNCPRCESSNVDVEDARLTYHSSDGEWKEAEAR